MGGWGVGWVVDSGHGQRGWLVAWLVGDIAGPFW